MTDLRDRYRDEMGHEPPTPGDHPLADQWDYRGTRDERATLAADLLGETDERGEQPEQDEALF